MLAEPIEEVDESRAGTASARCCASVPDRLVALLFDTVALSAIVFVAAIVVSLAIGPAVQFHDGAGSLDDAIDVDRGVAVVDALVAAALGAAYFIGSWRRGGTPGQRLLGLRVVRHADGSPPSGAAAAGRWLALIAPFSLAALLATALPGAGGAFWAALAVWFLLLLVSTARGPDIRGWHDRAAGTVVTRVARPVLWSAGRDR